jgi:hypothetical protein
VFFNGLNLTLQMEFLKVLTVYSKQQKLELVGIEQLRILLR